MNPSVCSSISDQHQDKRISITNGVNAVILDENMNELHSSKEVFLYAKSIGIDPTTEPDLMHIAVEGISAPLPKCWKVIQDENQRIFYHNSITNASLWDHPRDDYYRQRVIQTRQSNHRRFRIKTSQQESFGALSSCNSSLSTQPPPNCDCRLQSRRQCNVPLSTLTTASNSNCPSLAKEDVPCNHSGRVVADDETFSQAGSDHSQLTHSLRQQQQKDNVDSRRIGKLYRRQPNRDVVNGDGHCNHTHNDSLLLLLDGEDEDDEALMNRLAADLDQSTLTEYRDFAPTSFRSHFHVVDDGDQKSTTGGDAPVIPSEPTFSHVQQLDEAGKRLVKLRNLLKTRQFNNGTKSPRQQQPEQKDGGRDPSVSSPMSSHPKLLQSTNPTVAVSSAPTAFPAVKRDFVSPTTTLHNAPTTKVDHTMTDGISYIMEERSRIERKLLRLKVIYKTYKQRLASLDASLAVLRNSSASSTRQQQHSPNHDNDDFLAHNVTENQHPPALNQLSNITTVASPAVVKSNKTNLMDRVVVDSSTPLPLLSKSVTLAQSASPCHPPRLHENDCCSSHLTPFTPPPPLPPTEAERDRLPPPPIDNSPTTSTNQTFRSPPSVVQSHQHHHRPSRRSISASSSRHRCRKSTGGRNSLASRRSVSQELALSLASIDLQLHRVLEQLDTTNHSVNGRNDEEMEEDTRRRHDIDYLGDEDEVSQHHPQDYCFYARQPDVCCCSEEESHRRPSTVCCGNLTGNVNGAGGNSVNLDMLQTPTGSTHSVPSFQKPSLDSSPSLYNNAETT